MSTIVKKQLPVSPSLEHLRKQAKRLAKSSVAMTLSQAQHSIAKEYGLKNWSELIKVVASMARESVPELEQLEKASIPKQKKRAYSDEAVKAKTGKVWDDWFRILDDFDGLNKGHAVMANYLHDEQGVPNWWCQMVTVEYERERGIRQINETTSGFSVSVSRVIAAPVQAVFEAWSLAEEWNSWLSNDSKVDFVEGGKYETGDHNSGVFRRIVQDKRIRFTWENPRHTGKSIVEVRFTSQTDLKASVTLEHMKLASADEKEDLRRYWSDAMDNLRKYLEGKPPSQQN